MINSLGNNQESKPLILLVDDDAENLERFSLTLRMEGYRVWTAMNGQQALDMLLRTFARDYGPSGSLPDLILADIMMPVMDGYTFYEQVRLNPYLHHIPFIFLTAKSDNTEVRFGKELGVDDYISKLAPAEDLLASVRGRLNRVRQRRAVMTAGLQAARQSVTRGKVRTLVLIIVLAMLAFYLGNLLPTLLMELW